MEKIHYFRPLYLALALTISLFSTASTPNRYKTSASLPDSLLTEQHIRSIYYTLPDSALSLLDEAEARRLPHLPQFRIDMLRGTVYERQGMYHLKERYIRRALQSDSVQHTPLRKLQVLTQLATALDRLNKYEEGIRICTEAIELAQEQGQKAKESELLFTLGRMYQGMKLDDKAFRYMYRSIELLQGTDNVRELAQLSTSYGDLSAYLAENERLDEAIALCEKRLDVISRMSLLPGPPPGYIDQQYGYLYSKLAWYYLQNGQSEKAAETARKYQSTGFAQSQAGQTEIVPYLLGTRQYHKVLQLLDASSALAEPADTFNYGHLILLDRYARTYRGLKRPELADSYQQRITMLTDSIYAREKAGQAHEFAIIYQTQEKDAQIREAQHKLARQRVLFITTSFIAILLAILLWEKHLHLRRTRERNQIAARQIEELLAQKEELRKAYRRQPLHPEDAPNEEPPAAQANTSPSAADDEDNRRRFMQMEDALLTDLPFLNPDFNREDLMKITALSKNRLNPFLREYADADGFSDYIIRLRVEHSISMLKDNKMYSIDAIATASGFKSRNTYYVAFNKLLGMTPVQYRETLPDKSAEPCTEPIV